MKICAIIEDLEKSASGKVGFTILKGLASHGHQIQVICSRVESDEKTAFSIIEVPYRYSLPDRLNKLLIVLLRSSYKFIIWEYEISHRYFNKIYSFNPDIIFSLGSGGGESVLSLGLKLSRRLKKPLALHMFDPIPSPRGWESYEIYRKSRIFTIVKPLYYADIISLGNPMMLEFQQKNLTFDILQKSFVLPDPIGDQRFDLDGVPEKDIITYLGSFSGPRKPDSLIRGFLEYRKKHLGAELHIVGQYIDSIAGRKFTKTEFPDIFFHSWTSNVRSIYEQSSVLVDVDADIPDDVFISSKVKGYLQQERIILLITRLGSPSSKLLGVAKNSVVITNHDYMNVSVAIEKALKLKNSSDILNDRKSLFEYFNVKRISEEVTENFEKAVKRRHFSYQQNENSK